MGDMFRCNVTVLNPGADTSGLSYADEALFTLFRAMAFGACPIPSDIPKALGYSAATINESIGRLACAGFIKLTIPDPAEADRFLASPAAGEYVRKYPNARAIVMGLEDPPVTPPDPAPAASRLHALWQRLGELARSLVPRL